MQKVSKEYYSNFIQLASANLCNTVYPMSIAEGFQEGDIYTDDVVNPTYALFWHVSGFAYLTGMPGAADMDDIYALMKNEGEKNLRRFVLELKDKEAQAYFEGKEDVEKHPRYRFRLTVSEDKGLECEASEDKIRPGYELKEVDAKLLSQISGRIVPSLFWSSAEEFLEKGKGYCLVCDGEVAAVAFSAAVSSRQVDIGIETKDAHRRKGLAAIAAKQMVSYVKSIGKEPVWDCDAVNTGSRATAEKVGFEVMAEHAYYKV